MPTEEQYIEALAIIKTYEDEQDRLLEIRKEAFKSDLEEYFKTNKLDSYYEVEEVSLRKESIRLPHKGNTLLVRFEIFVEPYIDGRYSGGDDTYIEELAKKHNIDASIYSGYYPK